MLKQFYNGALKIDGNQVKYQPECAQLFICTFAMRLLQLDAMTIYHLPHQFVMSLFLNLRQRDEHSDC